MLTPWHYLWAVLVTLALAVIDILYAFPVPSRHLGKILNSLWFFLYVLFYPLATLMTCLIFDEQGIIDSAHPMSWALGLGIGVFLFLQAEVQFNLPWISSNKDMALGLKKVAEKWKGYCYLRIAEELQAFRRDLKAELKSRTVEELTGMLEEICSEQQFKAFEPLIEENKAISQEKLKGFLISAIVSVNSAPLEKG